MEAIKIFINISASLLEILGTGTIVITALYTISLFLFYQRRKFSGKLFYRSFRHHLGHGILLGLEFLVAADIIRSVAIEPTLDGLVILAGIVLVRTFLSLTLEVEISGKWPWQSRNENIQN
ncbi:MAG: DUF1622 domain-containing protein [Fibrobacter sp.]|mgnify:CR=1 FL=1|nr:DUF1622 domain-containing protein [Fibrobacter sp.]